MDNRTLENIELYVTYMENKCCQDIVENTKSYDEENIDFWFNQYWKVYEYLDNFLDEYTLEVKYNPFPYEYLRSMILLLKDNLEVSV